MISLNSFHQCGQSPLLIKARLEERLPTSVPAGVSKGSTVLCELDKAKAFFSIPNLYEHHYVEEIV